MATAKEIGKEIKIKPKLGVRVPAETQKKADLRRAQLGFKTMGEYITSIIEQDYDKNFLEALENASD